ncbi:TIM barrel protein [Bradyrhizobium sp. CIAT3101]|uniref:sugar phosphate isomerase/epimerase family protein n=1 Tax=Bradyrhizobium sp. CIAT3101 TaxID=439387 RepID=UPI0024B0E5F6|nr:TIM barrel protein [Bradyrhizobium sp. CIAT3101]WFU78202.1 TIM barrel protein [Bradyrhizobium sp. CIAT3101]
MKKQTGHFAPQSFCALFAHLCVYCLQLWRGLSISAQSFNLIHRLMRIVSLAHLTLPGASPLQLIDHAAQAGFDHIGMRIVAPTTDSRMALPLGDRSLRTSILRRLAETGIKVLDIEAWWLSAEFNATGIEPAFGFGAEMGARYAIVSGNDPVRNRFLDHLDVVCQIGARVGVQILLEFIPYSQVCTIWDAADCLASINRPNIGILVDALHLSRSGGSVADVVANLHRLRFLHLCDAPKLPPQTIEAMRHEARGNRLYPGEGELDLRELIAVTPADVPIAIEAPHAGFTDQSPVDKARRARVATLDLITDVERTRRSEEEKTR